MSAATQIYYASFDAVFLNLPPSLQVRVETQIDDIGSRLRSYPPTTGSKDRAVFRARVGDYRITYIFDLEQNTIHLLAIGHRRENLSHEVIGWFWIGTKSAAL